MIYDMKDFLQAAVLMVVMVMSVMFSMAVPFMDMLPVAVKILHIMVMVLMRLIQHHIKITYIQP